MIPEISLPSNPEKVISLNEATVKDAIDFTDIEDGHEEQVTTLFLNRVQPKSTRVDPKTWTADDRRTVLFWYWLHTAKDTSIALSFSCAHCGESHSFLQDMRLLGESYRTLKGGRERAIRNGLIVRPMTGEDAEYLERARLSLSILADERGEESGAYRKLEAQIRLLRLLLCLHTKKEPVKLADRVDAREKEILAMTTTGFGELAAEVEDALDDMAHGLETVMDKHGELFLLAPPYQCPGTEKEVTTRLRVPFRNIDYIPNL